MVLVGFIHSKPRSVLIGEFQLSLVILAFAALGQGIAAAFLNVFSQVSLDVLGIFEHLALLLESAILGLNVGEAVCVD